MVPKKKYNYKIGKAHWNDTLVVNSKEYIFKIYWTAIYIYLLY